ncbi:MAG TPA: hypothetical protein VGK67_13135 [Myxococcales bacterium]|jgi:hypothetical protein
MKNIWSFAISAASCLVLCVACAGIWSRPTPSEKLFFALQIEDGERVVARPQVVGEVGKRLTLKLVEPDRPDRPRLALELVPEQDGDGYRVQLKLALPDRDGEREGTLALGHGEERQMQLADPVRKLSVRVMLMRVASPEFQAWLRLAQTPPATS